MFWVCGACGWETRSVCHHPSRTKKNVTHKKKKIFGLTAAELEGKKHTTTRGGAFLKTRLFAESLPTHVFECVFSGSVILRFHKWPYSHKISNQANTHFYRPCQSLKSCSNAQQNFKKRYIAVEKKQHRIRAVKQAKVLYTLHIIQMNWDTKAWVFYPGKLLYEPRRRQMKLWIDWCNKKLSSLHRWVICSTCAKKVMRTWKHKNRFSERKSQKMVSF